MANRPRNHLSVSLKRLATVAALVAQPFLNLNTSTLAVQAPPARPIVPVVSENPCGPVFPVSLRTHLQSLNQTTLAPAAQVQPPFVPVDLPNPRAPTRTPDYIRSAQTQLIGQDALPKRQTEWPNPQPLRRGQDFTGPNLQGTTLAPAAPAGTPFSQTDWQNPAAKKGVFRATLNLYQRPADLPPPPVTPKPVPPSDFPNPPRKTYDLTVHSVQIRQPAEETQSIFTYDWPNPQPRPYPVALRTWIGANLVTTTLAQAPAQIPSGKFALPEPRGPLFSIELRSWVRAAQVQLIGQDALPSRQRDWQNPRTSVRAVDLLTHIETTPINLIQPYNQSDWPNPQAARRPQDFIGANLHGTTLAPVVVAGTPFSQTDWPNPRGVRGIQPFDPPNLLTSTLFVAPVKPPLAFDFPNPPLGKPSRAIGNIFNRPADVPPPAPAGTPFSQSDWPVPRRATVDVSQHTLQVRLPAEETPSIGQNDWLNPQGKRYAIGLRTWTNGDLLTTTLFTPPVALPIGKAAFPEPRGYARAIDLRTWAYTRTHLLPTPVMPFRDRFDWRNPVRAVYVQQPQAMPSLTLLLPEPTEPPADNYRKIITLREDRIDICKG